MIARPDRGDSDGEGAGLFADGGGNITLKVAQDVAVMRSAVVAKG